MSTTDHALATREARENLKMTLRRAFRDQNTADAAAMMAAFDALLVAERNAAEVQWRAERVRDLAHGQAVAQAREATEENRAEARRIRDENDPDRRCTNCGKGVPEVKFYHDKKRIRPWCTTCECQAGRDRKRASKAPAKPESPERHLKLVAGVR